jgi:hypothetical protein
MSTPRNTGPGPSRRYRIARVATAIGSAALAGVLASLVACGDAPSAPNFAGRGTNLPALQTATAPTSATAGTVVNGLLWTKAVKQTTSSSVIGAAGGSLSIPNGIKVIVPKGAVASNVTFSVTRLPGTIVAYDFQPHGIKFAVPVQIEQPTLGTNLFKLDPAKSIDGAYFPDATSLDQQTGTVSVTEFEPTFVSADKAWIKFTVQHFSGYVVAWGRQ